MLCIFIKILRNFDLYFFIFLFVEWGWYLVLYDNFELNKYIEVNNF